MVLAHFTDNSPLPLLFVVVLAALALGYLFWAVSQGQKWVKFWAEANHYTLLSSRYRSFFKGPYFWTASRSQHIFYVTVEDYSGQIRHAWIKLGSFFLGTMNTDNIEVRWDD